LSVCGPRYLASTMRYVTFILIEAGNGSDSSNYRKVRAYISELLAFASKIKVRKIRDVMT
jgi:hypothetical protein